MDFYRIACTIPLFRSFQRAQPNPYADYACNFDFSGYSLFEDRIEYLDNVVFVSLEGILRIEPNIIRYFLYPGDRLPAYRETKNWLMPRIVQAVMDRYYPFNDRMGSFDDWIDKTRFYPNLSLEELKSL